MLAASMIDLSYIFLFSFYRATILHKSQIKLIATALALITLFLLVLFIWMMIKFDIQILYKWKVIQLKNITEMNKL